MKKVFFLLIIVIIAISCSDNEVVETVIEKEKVWRKISGTVEITLDSIIKNSTIKKTWEINADSIELKIAKNLTSNPYNLNLKIKNLDKDDSNSPEITFISDFDRKIIPGDRYRLITSIVLFGNTTFIPGTTGGQIKYKDGTGSYGFGFGSELEILIANEGEVIKDLESSQLLILSGTFVYDNNNLSTLEVGSFEIRIEGDNLIDTDVF